MPQREGLVWHFLLFTPPPPTSSHPSPNITTTFFFSQSTCHSLPVNQKKASTVFVSTLACVKLIDSCVTVRALALPRKGQWTQTACSLLLCIWKRPQGNAPLLLQHMPYNNAANDPSRRISAESWPSESYVNTCACVALSCAVRSWTLIKAAGNSCQPSALVLIDVVPQDCYMTGTKGCCDEFICSQALIWVIFSLSVFYFLSHKKSWIPDWRVCKTHLHVCCSVVFNVQWLKSFSTHFSTAQWFGTTAVTSALTLHVISSFSSLQLQDVLLDSSNSQPRKPD